MGPICRSKQGVFCGSALAVLREHLPGRPDSGDFSAITVYRLSWASWSGRSNSCFAGLGPNRVTGLPERGYNVPTAAL